MTARAKKDQLLLPVPNPRYLLPKIKRKFTFCLNEIRGHLGSLNWILRAVLTNASIQVTQKRHKLRNPHTRLLCQVQIIMLSGCRSKVTFWLMMRGRETEQLTDGKRDGEILVQLKGKISCPHTENLHNQVDRISFFFGFGNLTGRCYPKHRTCLIYSTVMWLDIKISQCFPNT